MFTNFLRWNHTRIFNLRRYFLKRSKSLISIKQSFQLKFHKAQLKMESTTLNLGQKRTKRFALSRNTRTVYVGSSTSLLIEETEKTKDFHAL